MNVKILSYSLFISLLSYSCHKVEEPKNNELKLELSNTSNTNNSKDNSDNSSKITPNAENKLENGLIVKNEVLIRCREDAIPKDGIVNLPYGIKEIGDYAFNDSRNLTSINIPNSVVSIGEYALGSCYFLEYISLGDNIQRIGVNAFVSSKITELILPKTLKEIGYYALTNYSLKTVICKAAIPPRLISDKALNLSQEQLKHYSLYNYHNQKVKLIIPRGTKKLYEKALGWKDFSPIVEE